MPGAEQERYARWLERGSRLGFVLLVIGLVVYLTGMVEPHVPIAQLPALWSLPADRFLTRPGSRPDGAGRRSRTAPTS